jgi:hypothetical protein
MFNLGFFKARFFSGLSYFTIETGEAERAVPTISLRKKEDFFEEELFLMLISLK